MSCGTRQCLVDTCLAKTSTNLSWVDFYVQAFIDNLPNVDLTRVDEIEKLLDSNEAEKVVVNNPPQKVQSDLSYDSKVTV